MDSQTGACKSGGQESGNQVITAFQRSLRGKYPFLQIGKPSLLVTKLLLGNLIFEKLQLFLTGYQAPAW